MITMRKFPFVSYMGMGLSLAALPYSSIETRRPCFLFLLENTATKKRENNLFYLFFSLRAGGIQQILQSDWFLERAEFSHTDRCSGRNPSRRSIFVNELAVIVNLSPFFRFHRRLINATLSQFTFRWQGKLL